RQTRGLAPHPRDLDDEASRISLGGLHHHQELRQPLQIEVPVLLDDITLLGLSDLRSGAVPAHRSWTHPVLEGRSGQMMKAPAMLGCADPEVPVLPTLVGHGAVEAAALGPDALA